MEYSWPLSVPQFSWWNKLRFASLILTNDRWTQGAIVDKFEREMAKYVMVNHAIFTSSGSTANTLLAMYLRDKAKANKNTVIFPATTWITSVAPFLREGFFPKFIDVNLEDFSMDLFKLEEYLKGNHNSVACVFITSLIGFTPDIDKITLLAHKYNVRVMMDNCENTLGQYGEANVSSFFTSTTSTYFGHQIQSVEGGFVFTNSEEEYEYFLMARNHGMLRHLPADRIGAYRNSNVDERFDFHMLGNNFRNTNLNAFLGLSDLKRANKYLKSRRYLYSLFCEYLNDYLILPKEHEWLQHAPFCLPLIPKPKYTRALHGLKKLCRTSFIETRPIISGNLLRQTCLARDNYAQFENSEYLHHNGFYIGLHGRTTREDVKSFCDLAKLTFQYIE